MEGYNYHTKRVCFGKQLKPKTLGVKLKMETEYRSSKTYALTMSYFPLVVAGFSLTGAMLAFQDSKFLEVLIWVLIGLCLGYLFFVSVDKFAVLITNEKGIQVLKSGTITEIPWEEVADIRAIKFVYPPIFKMKFHSSHDSVLFVPSDGWTLNLGFWSFEGSHMVNYLRERSGI